jgi:hypothetical protein
MWVGLLAGGSRRIYFSVAFDEVTNLTAPQANSIAAPFFAHRPNVIPFRHGRRAERGKRRARRYRDCGGARYLHAIHALPRSFQSLRLALSHGELLGLYRDNIAGHHLEAGVGTGFFIYRADR